jgi:hypothetical protein
MGMMHHPVLSDGVFSPGTISLDSRPIPTSTVKTGFELGNEPKVNPVQPYAKLSKIMKE